MKYRFVFLWSISALIWSGADMRSETLAAVPSPSETPVEVTVSGRTSTLKSITVVKVGKEIPETFSGNRVNNTEGFDWYVSQHYAFKTDYPEEKARYYLELLELAYPHYMEFFGREPVGIQHKRLTIVYASTVGKMLEATTSDGFDWKSFGAGGITQPGHNIAYQYPSGGLLYHQRYILIHEVTHLFQYCVEQDSPFSAYVEGAAETMGRHVYDAGKKQLTVAVLDNIPIANQLDSGRTAILKAKPVPTFEELMKKGAPGYEGVFIVVHFLLHSPEYWAKLNLLRDEKTRLGKEFEKAEVMDRVFAPWDKANEDFRVWLEKSKSTFHYISWAFEQDGNWAWSREARGANYTRTDIQLAPGASPDKDDWRMDYPGETVPPEVGVIQRGVAEPSIGCMIDLSLHPDKGRVGYGLGVVYDQPIKPFPDGTLFLDKSGKKAGAKLTVFNLDKTLNEAKAIEDVLKGDMFAESEVTQISKAGLDPVLQGKTENFVAEWDAWIKIDKTDTYAIGMSSDDGSWLWIDGKPLINNGGHHGMSTKLEKIHLESGMHSIRVCMFQGGGGYGIEIGWQDPNAYRPGLVRILIDEGKRLLVEGTELDIAPVSEPLPESFLNALKSAQYKMGMNLKIATNALVITLQTRISTNGPMESFCNQVPLTSKQRERLMECPMSMLSQLSGGAYMDVYFGVMPFIDAGKKTVDDPVKSAPANPFRSHCADEYNAVYAACWHLGKKAPAALLKHRDELHATMLLDRSSQEKAAKQLEQDLPALLKAIDDCSAAKDAKQSAFRSLMNPEFTLDLMPTPREGSYRLTASLRKLALGQAKGDLVFAVYPGNGVVKVPESRPVNVGSDVSVAVDCEIHETDAQAPFDVTAQVVLDWYGRKIPMPASVSCRPGIPKWYILGPFDNKGGAQTDTKLPPEEDPFTLTKVYQGREGKDIKWQKVERPAGTNLSSDFVLNFNSIFGPTGNAAVYAITWVEVPSDTKAMLAVGSEDGFVAWVNRKRVYSWLEGSRSYKARQNQFPIELKKGRNEVMLKVVLGWGGWVMGSQLLDAQGKPLTAVKYVLVE